MYTQNGLAIWIHSSSILYTWFDMKVDFVAADCAYIALKLPKYVSVGSKLILAVP